MCRGDKDRAMKLLPQDEAARKKLPAFELAKSYAYMGEKDRAIHYLHEAVSRHEFGATSMKQVPYFQPLRSDPRFIALERRVGLDP